MFNINQSICDKHGEFDERLAHRYTEDLLEAFGTSAEYKVFLEAVDERGYVAIFLDYAFSYIGVPVPEMSEHDFNEILFGLFPRKVSTEPESATAIVAELRAFFTFLHREYGLANAKRFVTLLSSDAERRLRDALSDPSNYGMAKSIFMHGAQSGFDMTTQEGMEEFMLEYNKRLLSPRLRAPLDNPLVIFDRTFNEASETWTPAEQARGARERDKIRLAKKAKRQARKKNRK